MEMMDEMRMPCWNKRTGVAVEVKDVSVAGSNALDYVDALWIGLDASR